ncbi:MAG: hypothetical protein RR315_05930, partial [Oscillospiraceae bacterium]
IPSMEPLKTFADSLKSDQASDADKEKLALANRILEADYHTKETKELDKKLTAMGNYINYLHDKKATAQSIEIATELQQKLDNQRNSIIYSDVVQKTEAVANDAGKSYKERGALTDLVTILSDAKSTLDSEIQAFSSKALIRGTTIIDICVYEQSLQLISAAMARNFSGADKFLGIMVNIENINEKKIVDREKELEIAVYLADLTENAYKEQLSKGDTGALAAAVAAGGSGARIEENKFVSQLEAMRAPLQNIVTAVEMRKLTSEKRAYMDSMLQKAGSMKELIPKDYGSSSAEANLNQYIEFLSGIDASVIEKTEGKSESAKLLDELAGVNSEIKLALDKNNITAADSLQKKADSLQKALDSLDKKAQGQLDALEKEKAELEKKMSDARTAGDIGKIGELASEKSKLELEINKTKAGLSDSAKALSKGMTNLKTAILDSLSSPSVSAGDYAAVLSQLKQLSGY